MLILITKNARNSKRISMDALKIKFAFFETFKQYQINIKEISTEEILQMA